MHNCEIITLTHCKITTAVSFKLLLAKSRTTRESLDCKAVANLSPTFGDILLFVILNTLNVVMFCIA